MNQAKRVRAGLACLLVLLLCLSGFSVLAENRITYTDVAEDYWAAPYIYEMTNREIVGGYGDGTFGPLNQVERCEYAKMLTNIAGLPMQAGSGTPYADVDTSQWYFPYVKATQAYINGFNDNGLLRFHPEEAATREDVTVALMKALGDDLSEYYYIDNLLADVFWDYESIAVHNRPYVAAAVDRGFITGHQDGSFKGGDGIQRDEMCAILHRAFPAPEEPETPAEQTPAPGENVSPSFAPAKSGELQVFYLDVGQGDSTFLELPNGETALIDAGTAQSGRMILDFIKGRGHSKINYLVATHPHADHIGGMTDVVNGIQIDRMYMPEASTNTKTYENLLSAIVANNIEVIKAEAGVRLVEDGDLLAYFVAPVNSDYDDLNDFSAVIKLVYQHNSFLFMGDAGTGPESEILNAGYDVAADVLKIGHHGSRTSTGESFLEAVHPLHAVISCAAVNSYGHPHKETLEKLQDFNVNVLRTDESGTISILSDGTTLKIQS